MGNHSKEGVEVEIRLRTSVGKQDVDPFLRSGLVLLTDSCVWMKGLIWNRTQFKGPGDPMEGNSRRNLTKIFTSLSLDAWMTNYSNYLELVKVQRKSRSSGAPR